MQREKASSLSLLTARSSSRSAQLLLLQLYAKVPFIGNDTQVQCVGTSLHARRARQGAAWA